MYSVAYDSGFEDLSFKFSSTRDTLSIYSESGIPSKDTLLLQVSNQIKDKNGKGFDGNQDGDPQYSNEDDSTLQILSYLVTDFDGSGTIAPIDLNRFIQGWRQNNFLYETGPAHGMFPYLITTPNKRFDIEDLMIFIRYWNWAETEGLLSFQINDGIIDNSMNYQLVGNNLEVMIGDFGLDLDLIHLQLKYNSKYKLGESMFQSSINTSASPPIYLNKLDSINYINDYVYASLNEETFNNNSSIFISINEVNSNELETSEIELIYEYYIGINRYVGKTIIDLLSIPDQFQIMQNYPNPFNPLTTIKYALPTESHIKINIYDILGRHVFSLVDTKQQAGVKTIVWSGVNSAGMQVSAGIYFYSIEAGKYSAVKKMILLK